MERVQGRIGFSCLGERTYRGYPVVAKEAMASSLVEKITTSTATGYLALFISKIPGTTVESTLSFSQGLK
jgi:hypothetical protein